MEQPKNAQGGPRVVSPKRTVTETDIVTFVNLVGLFEPPFIDMEFVKNSTGFGKRFAPGPFLISLAMGLGALAMVDPNEEWKAAMENEGIMGGFVGLEARIRNPVFPGDTVQVSVEIVDKKKTSKGGTIIDWYYVLRNQRGETVVEFTEKILMLPPETAAGSKALRS